MKTNLLIAISNLVRNPITNIISHYQGSNRANNMGDALETYVKDLFCNLVNEKDLAEKNRVYSQSFSYTGNQNNPPDLIIRDGDAVEVKKIESLTSDIALNSSYPKDKLYADSPMITESCKTCEENWKEKDIIYAIGVSRQNKIKALSFVYGDCYSASKEIYERVRNKIADNINELQDIEFSETKELGRVNKIDPLGITYLRIRGMWGISNPLNVFKYILPGVNDAEFFLNVILKEEKYLSFPEEDRKDLESLIPSGLSIKDIQIKSPNNPAKLISAKLISFKK